jgi:hypothetical protein
MELKLFEVFYKESYHGFISRCQLADEYILHRYELYVPHALYTALGTQLSVTQD